MGGGGARRDPCLSVSIYGSFPRSSDLARACVQSTPLPLRVLCASVVKDSRGLITAEEGLLRVAPVAVDADTGQVLDQPADRVQEGDLVEAGAGG